MKRSLFAKLLACFAVIIPLSLTTASLSIYWQSSRALDKQSEKYIAQVINNTSYQTDLYLQAYERVSTSILVSQSVKRFLEVDPTLYYQRYEYASDITRNVLSPVFIAYPQIHLIYIIAYNGNMVFSDGQGFADISDLKVEEHLERLKKLTPDTGAISIFKMSVDRRKANEAITIARKIRGVTSFEPKGVLVLEIQPNRLENIWRNVDVANNGLFFILDDNGNVIYYPEKPVAGSAKGEAFADVLRRDGRDQFIQTVGGRKWLFVSRVSGYSGWRLVMAIPLDELRKPISMVRTTTVAVGLLTMAAALWLAYQFSRSITRPIQLLKKGMQETERGIWRRIELPGYEDEIGGLVHRYNIMVNRLEEMIDHVYKVELNNSRQALALQKLENEKQLLEFQALQLQINPHFLYNTLESINSYAIIKDSNEISEIVEAMAYMLRYALQDGLEEVTLAQELNHVRNYLLIMRHRIQREVEIDVAVPPELLLGNMVRLTLQPLVENVFHHAFPDGIEPGHTIRIGASADGTRFRVTVEDSGAGIDPAGLERIRDMLGTDGAPDRQPEPIAWRGGIGLLNVHRRIRMVFGKPFGLEIDSEPGKGTRVTLNMPYRK